MNAIPDPRTLPIRRLVAPAAEKAKRPRIKRKHEEDDLQAEIVELFNARRGSEVVCFSVPNGGFRDWNTAKTLKRTGLQPGITDLVFLNILGIAFFMEVKTKKGSLSKEQREFRNWCMANNIAWVLVRTLAEAEAWMERFGLIKRRR